MLALLVLVTQKNLCIIVSLVESTIQLIIRDSLAVAPNAAFVFFAQVRKLLYYVLPPWSESKR